MIDHTESYLDQFRKFSKCPTLNAYLRLSHKKRKQILLDYFETYCSKDTIHSSNKRHTIMTFLMRNNKLPYPLDDFH